jgi:hypothetical protein
MPRLTTHSPLKALGRGLVVAAVTGAAFGTRLAWALLAGVALKVSLYSGALVELCVRLPGGSVRHCSHDLA